MDDTIALVHHTVMRQSELGGILGQCVDLFLGYRVLDGLVLIVRRGVMVRHTEYLLGTETLQTTGAQAVEGLGRSHFMTVESVDIQLCGTVVHLLDDMPVPDLIE